MPKVLLAAELERNRKRARASSARSYADPATRERRLAQVRDYYATTTARQSQEYKTAKRAYDAARYAAVKAGTWHSKAGK